MDYLFSSALLVFSLVLIVRRFARTIWVMARNAELQTLLISVVTLLVAGAFLFRRVEGWPLGDALYYCVITLTTVGYGDLTPHTPLGRAMAAIYVLIGIGMLAAFVTTVAQITREDVAAAGKRLPRGIRHHL